MKKVIIALVVLLGISITAFASRSSDKKILNFIHISAPHDLIVGIPGISKTEVETLLHSLGSVSGVKKVKFCYNMDCVLIIKDIKNPPSDNSLLSRIQNAVPGKQTFVKEYTTISEFEEQCNFIKK